MAAISRRSAIAEILECPICVETFTEPKELPCAHTFCLACLRKYCDDFDPASRVNCPICRKPFSVPRGGLSNLPNNYTIKKLLLIEASPAQTPPCSPSKEGGSVSERGASFCSQHGQKEVSLYCHECGAVLCTLCLAQHSRHDVTDLDAAAQQCVVTLTDDVMRMQAHALSARAEIERLSESRTDFMSCVDAVERSVSDEYNRLWDLIGDAYTELLERLDEMKAQGLAGLESRRDAAENLYMTLDSLTLHCVELKDSGTHADITRTCSDLHAQASKLLEEDKGERTTPGRASGEGKRKGRPLLGERLEGKEEGGCLPSELKLIFTPSMVISATGTRNIVGEIAWKDQGVQGSEGVQGARGVQGGEVQHRANREEGIVSEIEGVQKPRVGGRPGEGVEAVGVAEASGGEEAGGEEREGVGEASLLGAHRRFSEALARLRPPPCTQDLPSPLSAVHHNSRIPAGGGDGGQADVSGGGGGACSAVKVGGTSQADVARGGRIVYDRDFLLSRRYGPNTASHNLPRLDCVLPQASTSCNMAELPAPMMMPYGGLPCCTSNLSYTPDHAPPSRGPCYAPPWNAPPGWFGPRMASLRPTPRWVTPSRGLQNPEGGRSLFYPVAPGHRLQAGPSGFGFQQRPQMMLQSMPGAAPQTTAGQYQFQFLPRPRLLAGPIPASLHIPAGRPQPVGGMEPLTLAILNEELPQEQKQMLGERLFPLIHQLKPDVAGKITGMLLEIDNIELLHMLESKEALKAKVEEAWAVLQAHAAKKAAGGGDE